MCRSIGYWRAWLSRRQKTDIVCTPNGGTVIDLANRRATLTLAAADAVTCTYTVEQAVQITARAFNDLVRRGASLGKRNAGAPGCLTNLHPSHYTICTVLPAGSWTPTTPTAVDPAYGKLCKTVTLTPGQRATILFGAYQPTVVASAAFTPADELVTDEDTIVNLPYDPAEDETATEEDGRLRLFLPFVMR